MELVPGTVCEIKRTSRRPEVQSDRFPQESEEVEARVGGGEQWIKICSRSSI